MSSKPQQIFVNLPVAALEPSIAFYTALGFNANPKFSDPTSMMMVLSPTIYVMLLTPARFDGFLPADRSIADAKTSAQVLLCVSADSKTAVDQMIDNVAAAGGTTDVAPMEKMGDYMYGRSFADLDGHVWEVVWMDEQADTYPPELSWTGPEGEKV